MTETRQALTAYRYKALSVVARTWPQARRRAAWLGLLLVAALGAASWFAGKSAHLPYFPAAQPQRASIVDRNGVTLARSVTISSLYADPARVIDRHRTALALAEIFQNHSAQDFENKLSRPAKFVWLERHLTPEQFSRAQSLKVAGLYFRREASRAYPFGALTAHIVGGTNVDNNGFSGIEGAADKTLKISSEPLRLTLDVRLQQILKEEIEKTITRYAASGGAGVIMDAHSAQILGMVSLPDFDPGERANFVSPSAFSRASHGVYDMGGLFQIVTIAHAFEQGMNPDTIIDTQPLQFDELTLRDFAALPNQSTISGIFRHSSPPGTARIALSIGGEQQKEFMERLGLLKRALPEIRESGEPLAPRGWNEDEAVAKVAVGRGLAVTPLHMAAAVAAIVNGGEYRAPTLLFSKDGNIGVAARALSPDTSGKMRQLLAQSYTLSGASSSAAALQPGGKSGIAPSSESRRDTAPRDVVSYVATFPINDPRYVVYVMIEAPRILSDTFPYAGMRSGRETADRLLPRIASIVLWKR